MAQTQCKDHCPNQVISPPQKHARAIKGKAEKWSNMTTKCDALLDWILEA